MNKKFSIFPYLFIAPHLLLFTVFLITPTITGFIMSFFKWDYITKPVFVGLKNYGNLLDSNAIDYLKFWTTFGNTLKFVVITVPLLIIISLFLAILLNEKMVLRNFFRFTFYAPVVLSVTVACMIWRWILEDNVGIVGYYLNALGLQRIHWLSQDPYIWLTIVIITIWWLLGTNFIFFMAGLQEVPKELYEAAEIDGAKAWGKFWNVTLPGIKRTMFFVLVTTTLGQFNIFGQPYILYGGRMPDNVQVLLNYVYQVAFDSYRMGSAAAMTVIMGITMVVISAVQYKLMRADD